MQNCRRMGLCHVISLSVTVITELLSSDQKGKQDSKTCRGPMSAKPQDGGRGSDGATRGGTQTGKQRCRISTCHIHRELEEAKLLCLSTTVQSQILLGREDLTQNIQNTLPKGKKKILNSTRLELTSAYQ